MHVLVIVTGFYLLYYLWWRAQYTMNYSALILSIILLIAEIQGVINFFLYALMTWNTEKKEIMRPLEGAKVDVFIPTYNEDIEVLEATLVGCLNMRQEHTTYLLDDGRRDEVKLLAEKFDCQYLTRPDNKFAKAGNINAALKKTSGEFIVVLDADMVPQPDFLEKTLGYFRDPKTAIVQMPQEFYNLDSMQHTKSKTHWHEQQLFFHVLQPGKNNINAAFWCGSPSVLRRSALESIGGVATESITEDFLTSIILNSKGWNIKYHDEVLAFGIAPQSFHAFNLQRLRWAQGSMKILRSKYNPLIIPGLTIKQRLSHFSAIFTYFDAYQKLIYLLIPSVYLFTDILPIHLINTYEFIVHWLPYFTLSMSCNILLGRGYFKYFEVEKYNTMKMMTFIKASFTLIWPKNLVFKVTPKSVEADIKVKERRELTAQILILTVTTIALFIGLGNVVWNFLFSYSSMLSAVSAIFWSLFNLYILFITLQDVLKRVYFRKDYRFPVYLDAKVTDMAGGQMDARIENISRSGVGLVEHANREIENLKNVKINMPDGILSLSGNIVYKKASDDGVMRSGVKFEELALEDKKRLYKFLFVTAPRNIYDSSLEESGDDQVLDSMEKGTGSASDFV